MYLKSIKDKYSNLSVINKLSLREKLIILLGFLFLLTFFSINLMILPLNNNIEKLDKKIDRKKNELLKIQQLQKEFNYLKAQESSISTRLEKRQKDFNLFAFLDNQADIAGLKKNIKSMKPSTDESEEGLTESLVEIKMQEVSLKSIVNFLGLIESQENIVFIRRITIDENNVKEGFLDLIVQVVTFKIVSFN